jgi:hypothetical protein
MNGTFTSYAAVLTMPAGQMAHQRTICRTGPVTSAIDLWVAGLVWRAPRADAYDGGLLLSVAPLMAAVVLAESRYQFCAAPCS